MTTHFFRLANLFKHLQPELAGELCVQHILGALRFLPRTILHYPQLWLTGMDCMTRGDDIGLAAPPLFMADFAAGRCCRCRSPRRSVEGGSDRDRRR